MLKVDDIDTQDERETNTSLRVRTNEAIMRHDLYHIKVVLISMWYDYFVAEHYTNNNYL